MFKKKKQTILEHFPLRHTKFDLSYTQSWKNTINPCIVLFIQCIVETIYDASLKSKKNPNEASLSVQCIHTAQWMKKENHFSMYELPQYVWSLLTPIPNTKASTNLKWHWKIYKHRKHVKKIYRMQVDNSFSTFVLFMIGILSVVDTECSRACLQAIVKRFFLSAQKKTLSFLIRSAILYQIHVEFCLC